MSTFEVSFQLVDSPVEKSESGGRVDGDALVGVFRDFPFRQEIDRAKEGATFPTIMFKRVADGEELSVWTVDTLSFDLCLIKNGKKWFVNSQPKEKVEEILTRFRGESLSTISPPSIWRRIFG